MSNLEVIIPLSSLFIPALSPLRLKECQWRNSHDIYLPLRRIGRCNNHLLLEEIDYALSRLKWPVFSCSIKHVTFRTCDEGYRLGLAIDKHPALLSLYQKVTFALHRAGIETPRRRFTPFIELGLMAYGQENILRNWLDQHAMLSLPTFRIDHLALIEDYSDKTYGQLSLLENYGPEFRHGF